MREDVIFPTQPTSCSDEQGSSQVLHNLRIFCLLMGIVFICYRFILMAQIDIDGTDEWHRGITDRSTFFCSNEALTKP